jgi:hypothetical protein
MKWEFSSLQGVSALEEHSASVVLGSNLDISSERIARFGFHIFTCEIRPGRAADIVKSISAVFARGLGYLAFFPPCLD